MELLLNTGTVGWAWLTYAIQIFTLVILFKCSLGLWDFVRTTPLTFKLSPGRYILKAFWPFGVALAFLVLFYISFGAKLQH